MGIGFLSGVNISCITAAVPPGPVCKVRMRVKYSSLERPLPRYDYQYIKIFVARV